MAAQASGRKILAIQVSMAYKLFVPVARYYLSFFWLPSSVYKPSVGLRSLGAPSRCVTYVMSRSQVAVLHFRVSRSPNAEERLKQQTKAKKTHQYTLSQKIKRASKEPNSSKAKLRMFCCDDVTVTVDHRQPSQKKRKRAEIEGEKNSRRPL